MVQAVDVAYDVIRQAIIAGDVPPGGRLREEEFAERAGVSRTPVREALLRLQSEGFVALSTNRGARVAQWSTQQVIEIFDLRLLLEPFAAECAARAITDTEVDRLDELAENMAEAAEAGDIVGVTALNNEFHDAILSASGNAQLAILARGLMHLFLIYRTFQVYDEEAMQRSLQHHRELVVALRSRDGGWARAVMSAHIHAGLGQMLSALEKNSHRLDWPGEVTATDLD